MLRERTHAARGAVVVRSIFDVDDESPPLSTNEPYSTRDFALSAESVAPWPDVALPDEVEAKLIERLVARDERAFNELVQTYGRRVSALVLRFLGNKAEAEDLTQEVFVQVFKAIGTFRGDSKLSTWIYRIAVNLCKNRSKYLRVRHSNEQDELEAVAERMPLGEGGRSNVAQIERPDEAMAGRQVEKIVQDAIQKIDPTFRECLILRDVEELSYEEIEEITGLAAGTVKSRIFRARAQLKEIVERELGEKIT
ncbi:MAG: sigma-70 family RNA polymerase sigma factor [Deltaproteobacteria bacterium]|nr:sigma-70 family RNA polymerase sigma factor [Deltaproteobacteria bacterium]